MLESLGISVNVVKRLGTRDEVNEGIEAVRRRFGSLWIDKERCAYFLKALKQYRKEWDDKMGKFKNKPLHDWSSHAGDIIRYWAITPELYRGELKFSY